MLQPKLLLIEIPGLVGVILGFFAIWFQAVPTVVPPSGLGDTLPLAAPFTIENRGWLFDFNDVTTTCQIDKVVWDNASSDPPGISIPGMTDRSPQHHAEIATGRSVAAGCMIITAMKNISKFHISGDLASARAQITVKYTKLFIERTYVSQHYCWTPTPPAGHQWVLCDSL
jgi:hypothetical protein